jgi:hypothetical protein
MRLKNIFSMIEDVNQFSSIVIPYVHAQQNKLHLCLCVLLVCCVYCMFINLKMQWTALGCLEDLCY